MSETGGSNLAQHRARSGPSVPHQEPTSPAPPIDDTTEWFFSQDGQSFGPMNTRGLLAACERGQVGVSCYVWCEALGDWQPAHSTPPFDAVVRRLAHQAPTPPPQDDPASPPDDATVPSMSMDLIEAQRDAAPDVDPSTQARQKLQALLGQGGAASTDPSPRAASTRASQSAPSLRHKDVVSSGSNPVVSDIVDAIDLDSDGVSRMTSLTDLQKMASESGLTSDDAIDLDFDGASRVVNLADIAAGRLHSAGARSSETPSGIDLDVDGASRPIRLSDLHSPASSPALFRDDLRPDALTEGGEERSMLIHIGHLRAQQRRSKMRALWAALIALVLVGAVIGVSVYVSNDDDSAESSATTGGGGISTLSGQTIALTDEQLDKLAPANEFVFLADAAEGWDEEAVAALDPDERVDAPEGRAETRRERRRREQLERQAREGSSSAADPDARAMLEGVGERGADPDALASARVNRPTSGGGLNINDADTPDGPELRAPGVPSAGLPGMPGSGSRRERVGLGRERPALGAAAPEQRRSGVSQSEQQRLITGIREISRSVHTCTRRQMSSGSASLPPKVYLRLRVEPSGELSRIKLETDVPEAFETCLMSQQSRWRFGAGDGEAVSFRQGFVIDP